MHKNLEKNLAFLIEEFSHGDTSIDNRWKSIIQRFFSHCKLIPSVDSVSHSHINAEHNVLEIPSICLSHGYILHGSKIPFKQDDVELANSLLKLTKQFITIEEAVEKGATEERLRIARDLHDDVAARILTLIHTLKDKQAIALSRSTLKSLRNAIYTLDNKTTASILDAITDIRSEIQDRLNPIGMQLLWSISDNLEGLNFTPRQHINLNRILHEVTTNIIRHANARFMEVILTLKDQKLTVECSDNGQGFDIENCIPGKGLNNIQTRIHELNGEANWFNLNDPDTGENKGSCIQISFLIAE